MSVTSLRHCRSTDLSGCSASCRARQVWRPSTSRTNGRAVEAALDSMIDRGLVELEWCDPATPRSLRHCLRDGTFHILHFVGHSDFDATGEGALYLSDEHGQPTAVTDAVLTALLGDQTSLRLVVLNSCKGARTTLTDPFSGIATSLVALGVPAVVAMQFSISDDAAIVFAEELFTSLVGRQYPIDAAVSEARKAIFAEVSEIEWATPVLFLRAFDGRLFEFAAEPSRHSVEGRTDDGHRSRRTPGHFGVIVSGSRRRATARHAASPTALADPFVDAGWA